MRHTLCFALFCMSLWTLPAHAQLGGGQGGVYVDPEGVLRVSQRTGRPQKQKANVPEKVAVPSKLRRISLKSLDQQLRKLQPGQAPPAELALLAGLVEIDYVIIDRDRQDVWIAGPAEGWEIDQDGRELGIKTGRPVIHLQDLAAALRCVLNGQGFVECSIDPQQDGLVAIQRYELPSVTKRRDAVPYQDEIKQLYGLQTVRTSGVPEGSRFALVMIEADYRMKRMALEDERVRNVTSHLEVLSRLVEEGVSRQNVLARWWFAPLYTAIRSDTAKSVFQFEGQAVQLLNEAVFLDRSGTRHAGGQQAPQWDDFSKDFTQRFGELEQRYPVFADLRNLFDLMMVAGLIRQQGLSDWFADNSLLDPSAFPLPRGTQPKLAEPVVNFRLHARRMGNYRISYSTFGWGGVAMRPSSVLAPELFKSGDSPVLANIQTAFTVTAQPTAPLDSFWQDAARAPAHAEDPRHEPNEERE